MKSKISHVSWLWPENSILGESKKPAFIKRFLQTVIIEQSKRKVTYAIATMQNCNNPALSRTNTIQEYRRVLMTRKSSSETLDNLLAKATPRTIPHYIQIEKTTASMLGHSKKRASKSLNDGSSRSTANHVRAFRPRFISFP